MRPCPNCGQAVATDADRFCPHCGYALGPAPTAGTATAPSATYAQPAYQPAPQTPAQQPYTFTAQAPDPAAYSAPDYTRGPLSGTNLPLPRVQQATPSPARTSNALMKLVASMVAGDTRSIVTAAAAVVVALVAIWLVISLIGWLFSHLLLILLVLAFVVAVGYTWQRRQRRGRRLP